MAPRPRRRAPTSRAGRGRCTRGASAADCHPAAVRSARCCDWCGGWGPALPLCSRGVTAEQDDGDAGALFGAQRRYGSDHGADEAFRRGGTQVAARVIEIGVVRLARPSGPGSQAGARAALLRGEVFGRGHGGVHSLAPAAGLWCTGGSDDRAARCRRDPAGTRVTPGPLPVALGAIWTCTSHVSIWLVANRVRTRKEIRRSWAVVVRVG